MIIIILIGFLAFSSKISALTTPELAITSNNYSVGEKITLKNIYNVEVGNELQLYAIIQASNDLCLPYEIDDCFGKFVSDTNLNGVTWSSSNTNVATIDSFGKVIGISKGTTIINASYNDYNASYDLTVGSNGGFNSGIMFYYDEPGPSMILNTEEKYSVGLIEIPSTEKRNIEFSVEDENIAKITKVEYDKPGADAIVTIKYLSLGKTKLISSISYNGETYTDIYEIDVKASSTSTTQKNNDVVNPKTKDMNISVLVIISIILITIILLGYYKLSKLEKIVLKK